MGSTRLNAVCGMMALQESNIRHIVAFLPILGEPHSFDAVIGGAASSPPQEFPEQSLPEIAVICTVCKAWKSALASPRHKLCIPHLHLDAEWDWREVLDHVDVLSLRSIHLWSSMNYLPEMLAQISAMTQSVEWNLSELIVIQVSDSFDPTDDWTIADLCACVQRCITSCVKSTSLQHLAIIAPSFDVLNDDDGIEELSSSIARSGNLVKLALVFPGSDAVKTEVLHRGQNWEQRPHSDLLVRRGPQLALPLDLQLRRKHVRERLIRTAQAIDARYEEGDLDALRSLLDAVEKAEEFLQEPTRGGEDDDDDEIAELDFELASHIENPGLTLLQVVQHIRGLLGLE